MYSAALKEQCNVQNIEEHVQVVKIADGTPLEPTPDIKRMKCTGGRNRVPRPFGPQIHSDRRNEIINFDFLFMEKRKAGLAYCLIIKDDASLHSWLIPAVETTAEEAANAFFNGLQLLRHFQPGFPTGDPILKTAHGSC